MAKNEILYRGKKYNKIRSGNCYMATSLLSDSLEVNTLSFVLESEDTSLLEFKRHDPIVYSHNGRQVGIFYVDSIKRIAKNQYEFKAISALGLLVDGKHLGGIYTGQDAQTLIDDICGSIPHVVKNNLKKIKIYGWLPIDSPRNNLARTLFAIGATVKTDLDGLIHVECLWDGISGIQDQICIDSKVDYKSKYSSVAVTEHQYIKDSSVEEELVFEGAAGEESVIYMQEPHHSYRSAGITIKESGANYATISGTGSVYGKPYRHSERLVKRNLDATIEPKEKEVTDATLVSLVNSDAVVSRMEAFYKCDQTIEAPAYYTGEKPGDRVAVEHPYDSGVVTSVVQSMDISISNTLKSNEKMLVGFVPPKVEEAVTYDKRDVLTGSGTWVVPDGVSKVRAVLIGGGDGGFGGGRGGNGGSGGENRAGTGGKGGRGSRAGNPGKVLEQSIEVTPGEQIQYVIGAGAAHGEIGGATTFGSLSSENGSIPAAGYIDPVTSETFAVKGYDGVDGVDGENGQSSGVTLTGRYNGHDSKPLGTGGYAGGANGEASSSKSGVTLNLSGDAFHLVYHCVTGLKGYSGRDGRDGVSYGSSGGGGSGGNGGGGASGYTVQAKVGDRPFDYGSSMLISYIGKTNVEGGKGGSAGSGGHGADGCVILYYGVVEKKPSGPVKGKNGKIRLDKFGRLIVV